MTIALGSKVKDPITGFEGIATSKISYLTGCYRIGVTPKLGKDGKVIEAQYFDEPLLEVLSGPISLPTAGTGVG